jgi:hypothetical protein
VQDGSASDRATNTRRSLELLSCHRLSILLWIPSAMNESSGESDRSSANCHPKPKMGTVSDGLAGCAKCVANAISIAGMCACIAAGVALGLTFVEYNRVFWLVAALDAQLRLTANMLDGMVALASRRDSKVGELYNEVPDRVSDAAVFIGAGYAWGRKRCPWLYRNNSGDLYCLRSRRGKNRRRA